MNHGIEFYYSWNYFNMSGNIFKAKAVFCNPALFELQNSCCINGGYSFKGFFKG